MPRKFILTAIALVLLIIVTSSAGASIAAAQAVTITFEDGADRAPVSVAGARFSISNGGGWVYGDVQTRRYNAPHPQSCGDRPAPIAAPTCEYAVDGNIFVWTGVLGAEGRIAFTDRQASFVELSFSTGANLNVVAYNSADEPIVATAVEANAGTGRLSTVRLEAPRGEAISSLTIGGVANFWLLDNLVSDALPLPNEVRPAQISAALLTTPDTVVRGGDLLTYTVVLTNRGRGLARDARISLPLDQRLASVVDAQFSHGSAWVSTLRPDLLEFRSGALVSGTVLTATLRLRMAPELPDGTPIESRLRLSWSDATGGGSGLSNARVVVLGTTIPATGVLPVDPPAGPVAQKRTLSSNAFIPGEPVGLWYHSEGGQAVGLGTHAVDSGGVLSFSFDPQTLAPGSYQVVAQGLWSSMTLVGAVQVQ